MSPKFLQFNVFYPAYLEDFYSRRPKLRGAAWQVQIDALLDEGFSESHIFSRRLKSEGFETFQVAVNDLMSQSTWMRENRVMATLRTDITEVALKQIETIKPDIVYTTDITALDSKRLATLTHKPRVIAGWRGFPIPPETDLSAYDLILTSFDRIFTEATARGAKRVERFHPGFPENSPVVTEPRNQEFDVVFSGSVTRFHTRRIQLINMLAELSQAEGFSFGLFMPDSQYQSPLAHGMNRTARWGNDMLRLLRDAGIVINIDIDEFGNQPPNMRLIEATGAGAFLLTPDHPELPKFFEPGVEVETFRTPQELIAKIRYYVKEPAARLAIAEKGQARCLKDHSLASRTPWFRDLMLQALAQASR